MQAWIIEMMNQFGYLGAVSYTHLDVYKRQMQGPAMSPTVFDT